MDATSAAVLTAVNELVLSDREEGLIAVIILNYEKKKKGYVKKVALLYNPDGKYANCLLLFPEKFIINYKSQLHVKIY